MVYIVRQDRRLIFCHFIYNVSKMKQCQWALIIPKHFSINIPVKIKLNATQHKEQHNEKNNKLEINLNGFDISLIYSRLI